MFHLSPKHVTRTLGSLKTKLPDTNPTQGQPSFAKVAECLYRNESSGIYYALVKRHSKQFRRFAARSRPRIVSLPTFNIERETLNLILEYARRDGLLLDNPAASIERRKQAKSKLVIPSRAQFRRLVEAIHQLDCRAWDGADLVELLACSGMRLSEATSLTCDTPSDSSHRRSRAQ